MAVAEEALGTFHGSDAFPIEWEEGEKELFWIFDDLHCPNPVSPMFFDIGGWWLTCDHMFRRFGTPFACDWIAKEINGYVYTAAVPADSGIRSEATEYQARYVPRVPRDPGHAGVDRRLPRLGPARVLRQLPRLVARALAPRDRAQLRVPRRHRPRGRHDARDGGLPRGRDRRPRPPLEDPLDAELRPVRVHDQPQRGHRRGPRRGGPGADGPAAVEPRGPQLGLGRGPLEAQGARQGRRRAARGVRGRHRARRAARARGQRGRPPVRRRGARAAPAPVRLQGDLVARVRVQDLARGPGADHRGGPRLPRHGLRLPGQHRRRPRRPRGRRARGDGGRRGRGSRAAADGARPVAGHEPAHARPPLLHRPGHERAAADRADRDRRQAHRGGRPRRPGGRDVPPLQRAAAADGRSRPRSTPRSSSPTAATTTRTRPTGARRRGSAPPRRRRSTSPTTRSGASRRSSTRASRRRPARSAAWPPRPASSRARRATCTRSRSSTRCARARSSSAA